MVFKFSFLLLMTTLSASRLCSLGSKKSPLIGAELIWEMPLIDTAKDRLAVLAGSNSLYFNGDLTAYKKANTYIKNNRSEEVFTYWVYQNKSKFGLYYNMLLDNKKGLKFDIDSFQRENTFKDLEGKLIDKDIDILVETKRTNHMLIEKYVPKIKGDLSYPDTTILYYDKRLINIPFSFSDELDSLKKAKLVKIRSIFNSKKNSMYKSEFKPRVMVLELRIKPIENPSEILSLFTRFKDDHR